MTQPVPKPEQEDEEGSDRGDEEDHGYEMEVHIRDELDGHVVLGEEAMGNATDMRKSSPSAKKPRVDSANLKGTVHRVSAPRPAQFESEAPTWLNTTVGAALAGVAHHQYAFASGSDQATMAAQARGLSGGVASWSTEICCMLITISLRLLVLTSHYS